LGTQHSSGDVAVQTKASKANNNVRKPTGLARPMMTWREVGMNSKGDPKGGRLAECVTKSMVYFMVNSFLPPVQSPCFVHATHPLPVGSTFQCQQPLKQPPPLSYLLKLTF